MEMMLLKAAPLCCLAPSTVARLARARLRAATLLILVLWLGLLCCGHSANHSAAAGDPRQGSQS